MATTSEILAVITTCISVAKALYELGVEMWPKIQIIIENMETLWNAYVNDEEITDEELAAIQAQTDALSVECDALYKAKYETTA